MSATGRHANYEINPVFVERWSPRAFSEHSMSEADMMTLFEAARWSPSASNLQPWRFVYALKGTAEFDNLVSALVEFNQGWAKNASALVYLVSVKHTDPARPHTHHSFDTGAAWMSLALQAHHMGLIAHGMAGLDYVKGAELIGLPDNMKLEAAIAIGKQGDKDSLPDFLKEREAPSERHALDMLVFKGKLG